MPKDTARQLANILSVLFALTINILANALPLNGQNTGEISDRFHVFFVPAGYVFAIWGVIFIGWIAFVIYQALPAHRESPRLRNLGYFFAVSCIFNAAWLFCWHYNQFGLSVVVMFILLALLIASYVRLDVGRTSVGTLEKWSVDIPFSLYLGWITVAAVTNVTSYLDFIDWSGFGIAPQVWAVIMLGVASLLGVWMTLSRSDSGYVFVLVWSFAGIAVKQVAEPLVATSAWAAALLALGLAVYSLVQRKMLTR